MRNISLPSPLQDDFSSPLSAIRILSDKGIKQAIKEGFLRVDPSIDFSSPFDKRLQPATIDLRLEALQSHFRPGTGEGEEISNLRKFDGRLRANQMHWVSFSDNIIFERATTEMGVNFLSYFLDGRSSLLRLGAVVLNPFAQSQILGIENLIYNVSPNDIILDNGERIAQSFIRVETFADLHLIPFNLGSRPPYTEQGDKVRALDMGVQVQINKQLDALSELGLMKIERIRGKKFESWRGLILLHAARAYRMKRIEGGIKFSERGKYEHGELFEPVDIRNKYDIKEGEHLVVEVEESFELSDRVGISVLNNLIGKGIPGGVDLRAFIPPKVYDAGDITRSLEMSAINFNLRNLRNSWIDPGYAGMMTGFPKLLGKSIQTGDVVGYGQAFYFPNGVGRPYGSAELGSQYQRQEKFQVAAK